MSDKVRGGAGPQTADTTIMASISCVTFNHVNYIRTALDSFLMQKQILRLRYWSTTMHPRTVPAILYGNMRPGIRKR